MHYNTIFSQLFQFIPRHRFEKSVEQDGADRYCKHFNAWRQFLTCLYAQITGKDSLREISDGLLVNQARLYHLGMEPVAKTTLADAMNRRNPEVFRDLFNELLDRCTELAPGHGFRFHNPLYALTARPYRFAFPRMTGHGTERTRGQSNSTHNWICQAIFHALS